MNATCEEVTLRVFVTLVLVVCGAAIEVSAQEPENQSGQLSELLTDLGAQIRNGLFAIGKPTPDNPYDRNIDLERYGDYQRDFELRILLEMDSRVQYYIIRCFESGMSLNKIIAMTQTELGWSEWPENFSAKNLLSVPGVQDAHLPDEMWQGEDNAVVILYQTHFLTSETRIHAFQNSFRTAERDRRRNIRECPTTYAVIVNDRTGAQAGQLYSSGFLSPRGTSMGVVSHILGYLPTDAESIPGIMLSSGPSGRIMHLSITHYLWNEEYQVWEGAGLWSSDRVLTYEYDGGGTVLTYFQCSDRQPDGPDKYGCPATVNLREYYLEHREEIEATRRKNARIGTLTPPREMYMERPTPPDEAKE